MWNVIRDALTLPHTLISSPVGVVLWRKVGLNDGDTFRSKKVVCVKTKTPMILDAGIYKKKKRRNSQIYSNLLSPPGAHIFCIERRALDDDCFGKTK